MVSCMDQQESSSRLAMIIEVKSFGKKVEKYGRYSKGRGRREKDNIQKAGEVQQ